MRVSYSAVNTFKSCPTKQYYQTKCRLPINASALPFGKAVEAGIDQLLLGKGLAKALAEFKKWWYVIPASKFGPAKPVFDDLDIFYYANDYDKNLFSSEDEKIIEQWYKELVNEKDYESTIKEAQDAIKANSGLDKNKRKFYHRVVWLCCRKRGMYMIKAFYDQILPQVDEVIAMQKQISMKADANDSMIGYVDYILKLKGEDAPTIFDLKTAGQLYDVHDLITSDQLRIYAAAENIKKIGYIVLLKSIKCQKLCDKCGHLRENYRLKKCAECAKGRYTINRLEGTTQLLNRTVTEAELEDVLDDFSDIVVAMKNDIRWKNPSECFAFNKKCDYYDVCWGDKTIEDLKKEIKDAQK